MEKVKGLEEGIKKRSEWKHAYDNGYD